MVSFRRAHLDFPRTATKRLGSASYNACLPVWTDPGSSHGSKLSSACQLKLFEGLRRHNFLKAQAALVARNSDHATENFEGVDTEERCRADGWKG